MYEAKILTNIYPFFLFKSHVIFKYKISLFVNKQMSVGKLFLNDFQNLLLKETHEETVMSPDRKESERKNNVL